MHRNVGRIGHQIAVRVEHRAGEIEPLLDVHRVGRVAQHHPGLLCHRHEQVVEHLEHHGVGLGADGGLSGARHEPREDQVVAAAQLRHPARLDDRGRVRLDEHGGPAHLSARRQALPVVDVRRPGGAVHVRLHLGKAFGSTRFRSDFELRIRHVGRAPDHLDGDRLHHVPLLRRDEAVLQLMGLLERRHHGDPVGVVQHQRRIRTLVAQMHFPVGRHA